MPPDYTKQLDQIIQALSHHEAIPSWVTGLIGTAVGFLLSLIADPVRQVYATWRMKNSIYQNIAYSRLNLRRAVLGWDLEMAIRQREIGIDNSDQSYARAFRRHPLEPSLAKIHVDVYSYYYDKSRELFLSVREHNEIREFYERLRYIQNGSADIIKLVKYIEDTLELLQIRVDEGMIDSKKLESYHIDIGEEQEKRLASIIDKRNLLPK
jgi:hypothetical protein